MDDRYEKLDDEGKKIFDDVVKYSSLFDNMSYPGGTDYSKHFIIFAYNYMTLGFDDLARKELKKVKREYFDGQIMNDAIEAKDKWNEAVEHWNNGREKEGFESQMQAQFLFCLLSIVTFMHKDMWTINGTNWAKFQHNLTSQSINLAKPDDEKKLAILHKYLQTVQYYNNRIDSTSTVE